MSTRAWGRLCVWVVVLAAGAVWAQGAGRLAEVSIGFRGVPVAGAWNPVRVVLRDVGAGAVELVLDQGNLREGERPWRVTVPIAGGAGVRVLDFDVFLPAWRSLVWTVDAGGARVASGALGRDAADRRPVDLVVSTRSGEVAQALGARVVDVAANELPARAAAYTGVRSVWVDGSAPLPDVAVLAAAAAAGAVVVVQDGARDAPGLAAARAEADAQGGWWATGGGGWWFGAPPDDTALTAARVDVEALASAFAAARAAPVPTFPAPTRIAVAVAVYVVLIVLGWRLGGAVGLVTWGWVVLAGTVLAVSAWRPPSTAVIAARGLEVGAGGLTLLQRAEDVLTLPAGTVSVPGVARPTAIVVGGSVLGADAHTDVGLDRWRGTTLLAPPQAASPRLTWGDDGRPRVVGDAALDAVRVIGGESWLRLEPGSSPGPPEDLRPLSDTEASFAALLPVGSAWARAGDDWIVLLPEASRLGLGGRP